MSELKIKLDDVMWTPSTNDANWRDALNNALNTGWNYSNPTLKMAIHKDWLKEMEALEVGDVVTTHNGDIGIVSKILEDSSIGIKRFEVIVKDKSEIYFSMNLKKIEEKK